MTRLLPVLTLAVAASLAHAQAPTPAGTWKTIDDASGEPKALVRIAADGGGVLSGTIEKLFRKPGEDPNPRCDKCEGARKGEPITGMQILWGLKPDGDEWTGGEILDPNNGRIYRARLRLADEGRKLEVRGFIGFSLLGRTQVWVRE
ncbi:MAG: DUF2147 domain-containing protein [Burkholderiales bacterium]|nr:DUF2147 domain-containing protein [Burkholderiales bacterium]